MREAFVNINDVPTHIMTWGNWIEESFSKKEVVICVTGNPGLPGFYTQFMATIHEQLGSDTPVWVIGKSENMHNGSCILKIMLFVVLKDKLVMTSRPAVVFVKCRHSRATNINMT